MVAALVSVMFGGLLIGSAVVARHRAQVVADMAALAAAARVPAGPAAACAAAQKLAAAMHAQVRQCVTERLDVIVTVTVAVGGQIGVRAAAVARAGPAG